MRISPHSALRIASCAATVLLVLELSARVDDHLRYDAPLTGRYTVETLYEPRGKTLHGRPGARYKKWRLNSLGFRGPEPSQGGPRIACLGSSETFGLYEAPEAEWPRQLERELRRTVPNASVINAAYPGMNLRSYRLQLQELAAVGVRTVVIYPSLANYIRADMIRLVQPPALPSGWDWRFGAKVRDGVKEALPEAILTPLRRWSAARESKDQQALRRIPEENVAMFQADLDALLDDIASHGLTAVLVTHATYFHGEVTDEARPVLTAWRRFYPSLAEEGFLDMERRLNDQLRHAAARRGLALVDAASNLPGGPGNFAEFVHLTDAGAETLARLVAPAVVRSLPKEIP